MDSRIYFRLLTLITFIFLISDSVWACPGCAGSMDKSGSYTKITYVLMVFIALTYIPFSILYGMIIKNRNFNKQVENEQK